MSLRGLARVPRPSLPRREPCLIPPPIPLQPHFHQLSPRIHGHPAFWWHLSGMTRDLMHGPCTISATPSESPSLRGARLGWGPSLLLCCFAAFLASAQIDPASGIDLVTITAPGNAPWMGDGTPGDKAIGRGSVGYDYRIGRFEVTSAQFVEFFNAAYDRPQSEWLPHLVPPDFWGGIPTTPNTPGGKRWITTSETAMLPTGDISWRMAAMYTNWLHNDKSLAREAFLDGAYDVSTFGLDSNGFTDQLVHHASARYWIPTWDEWLKAAHFDPNKDGPGLGGWWKYSNGTNSALIGAPPIAGGQANYGWDESDYPGQSPFLIPLGAYTNTQSPWGLFDVAGATKEWTEEPVGSFAGLQEHRIVDGSWWAASPANSVADAIRARSTEFPSMAVFPFGFRIASVVPAPSAGAALVCYWFLCARRNRGGFHEASSVRHRRGGRLGGGRVE